MMIPINFENAAFESCSGTRAASRGERRDCPKPAVFMMLRVEGWTKAALHYEWGILNEIPNDRVFVDGHCWDHKPIAGATGEYLGAKRWLM